MKKYLLIIALVCGAFISCKKSSSTTPTQPNCTLDTTSLKGSYKITAIKVVSSGVTYDGFSALQPCQQDDIYELKDAGVATISDAGVQCSPSDDATGTWSFSKDTLTSSEDNLSGVVSNFSCTGGFTLTSSVPVFGQPATTTITLVRQ